MANWQKWREMARESQAAAIVLEHDELLRSSASRFYYAAFQISTAVLLYLKLTPPVGEEGWSHASTPEMLREHLEHVLKSMDTRRKLARHLSELYKIRIEADYIGDRTFDTKKSALSSSEFSLTREAGAFNTWGVAEIAKRQSTQSHYPVAIERAANLSRLQQRVSRPRPSDAE